MTAARRAKSQGFILPRLIIFDFDGTLAESEIITSEVISAKLAAHGGHVQPDEITATLSGIERDDQLQHLESSFGLSLPRDFMELVGAEVHSLTSDILIATPGPIELLHWLTIPFCVALKTPRFELIHRMRAANLLSLIGPRFFSSDDIGFRKPDPSVLLLAAEVMGVAPSECLLVEDSAHRSQCRAQRKNAILCLWRSRHHSSQLLSDLQAFEPEAMVLHFGELKTLV